MEVPDPKNPELLSLLPVHWTDGIKQVKKCQQNKIVCNVSLKKVCYKQDYLTSIFWRDLNPENHAF